MLRGVLDLTLDKLFQMLSLTCLKSSNSACEFAEDSGLVDGPRDSLTNLYCAP
jgi:hypothetical protein